MEKINVLYTADKKYIKYTTVSILSLLDSNPDMDITIHLIYDNISSEDCILIESIVNKHRNANIYFYDFKLLEDLIKSYNIPKWNETLIPNARLFFDKVIKNVDNILYLDSDTIVHGSLKDLKKYDGTVNMVEDTMSKKHWQNLDSNLTKYCNSGVIWINVDKWEENDCSYKIIKTIENNLQLKFPDQDIINVALKDDISLLPPNYNIFSTEVYFPIPLLKKYYKVNDIERYSFKEINEAVNDPIIYHSTSFYYWKAWEDKCIHPYHQLYANYFKKLNFDMKKTNNIVPNELLFNLRILGSFYLPKNIKEKVKKIIK